MSDKTLLSPSLVLAVLLSLLVITPVHPVISAQPTTEPATVLGLGALVTAALSPDGSQLAVLSTNALTVIDTTAFDQPARRLPFMRDLYGLRRASAFVGVGALDYTTADTVLIRVPDSDTNAELALRINTTTGAQVDVSGTTRHDPRTLTSPAGDWSAAIPVPDAYLALALANGRTSAAFQPIPPTDGGRVLGGGFSPDGARFGLVYTRDGQPTTLDVWAVESGALLASRAFDGARDLRADFSGEYVVVSDRSLATPLAIHLTTLAESPLPAEGMLIGAGAGLVVYSLERGRQVSVYDLPRGEAVLDIEPSLCLARLQQALVSPDGATLYLVYSGGASFVERYDLTTGAQTGAVGGFAMPSLSLAASPDAATLYVAVGDASPFECARTNPGNGVEVYDLATLTQTTFLPTDGTPFALAVAPDGLLAVGTERRVLLFENGQRSATLADENWGFVISNLTFSADGAYLAMLNNNRTMYVWSRERLLAAHPVLTAEIGANFWGHNFAFDDATLLYIDGRTLRGFNLNTRSETFVLTHDDFVTSLVWHAPTRQLAVTTAPNLSDPTTVLIYALDQPGITPTLIRQATLDDLPSALYVSAFTPDGAALLLSQPNGDILPPASVLLDVATLTPRQRDTELMVTLPSLITPDGRFVIGAFGTILNAYRLP